MINQLVPNNVIVIGAPRSGTTLVGGLLCEGDQSFPMLPECTYITQIIEKYYNFLHYSDAQRFAAYAINEETLSGIFEHMVQKLLSTVLSHFEGMPYQYLVLKDPELTLHVDLIPRFFGKSSKVVCVIRDPRAVVASMVKVERLKRSSAWIELRKSCNLRTLLNMLQQFVNERLITANILNYFLRVHQSKMNKQKAVHFVRFENIVAHDEVEFINLETFLGFPVGRQGFGKVHFEFDRRDATYSENYGKAIQAPATDYKSTLNKIQINRIERLFANYNKIYTWW